MGFLAPRGRGHVKEGGVDPGIEKKTPRVDVWHLCVHGILPHMCTYTMHKVLKDGLDG